MNQQTRQAGLLRLMATLGLVGLLMLGTGCTTIRCYDKETVSDERPQDNSSHWQHS